MTGTRIGSMSFIASRGWFINESSGLRNPIHGDGAVKSMADGAHQEKPISLFYSYSLRGELEVHLSFLREAS